MKPADVTSLRMLRRARDRIDRDYAEPIGIPALAAGAGYSREPRGAPVRRRGGHARRLRQLVQLHPAHRLTL
jgi:hypothetical protein